MKLFRDLSALPESIRGASLAIGNFDGLHRGHRAILDETLAHARTQGGTSAVLTFEPHPREFFKPDAPSLRLMRLREKLSVLREMGFSAVFMPHFNAALAATSAGDFVSALLVEKLGVRHVVTGDNFCFGHKRGGTSALLADVATAQGFSYHAIAPLVHAGGVISSSAIRESLAEGDLVRAEALFGHPFRISGHITHGDKRGRELGFPTANISLAGMFLPRAGVYAVTARSARLGERRGVANIGLRPTVGGTSPRLEAHLFGEAGNLYGDYLQVTLRRFLRDEQKFASLDALKTQIIHDIQEAQS